MRVTGARSGRACTICYRGFLSEPYDLSDAAHRERAGQKLDAEIAEHMAQPEAHWVSDIVAQARELLRHTDDPNGAGGFVTAEYRTPADRLREQADHIEAKSRAIRSLRQAYAHLDDERA